MSIGVLTHIAVDCCVAETHHLLQDKASAITGDCPNRKISHRLQYPTMYHISIF